MNHVAVEELDQVSDQLVETQGNVDTFEAKIAECEARIVEVREERKLHELRLSKTEVTAPMGGTVLVKAVEQGELAYPGRSLAVLADLSEVELTVYLDEREMGRVKLGDPARVRVDAFPGRTWEGVVARVDPQAQFTPRQIHMPDERVRLVYGVILCMENPDRILKPGMTADAWIRWDDAVPWPKRLLIPQ